MTAILDVDNLIAKVADAAVVQHGRGPEALPLAIDSARCALDVVRQLGYLDSGATLPTLAELSATVTGKGADWGSLDTDLTFICRSQVWTQHTARGGPRDWLVTAVDGDQVALEQVGGDRGPDGDEITCTVSRADMADAAAWTLVAFRGHDGWTTADLLAASDHDEADAAAAADGMTWRAVAARGCDEVSAAAEAALDDTWESYRGSMAALLGLRVVDDARMVDLIVGDDEAAAMITPGQDTAEVDMAAVFAYGDRHGDPIVDVHDLFVPQAEAAEAAGRGESADTPTVR